MRGQNRSSYYNEKIEKKYFFPSKYTPAVYVFARASLLFALHKEVKIIRRLIVAIDIFFFSMTNKSENNSEINNTSTAIYLSTLCLMATNFCSVRQSSERRKKNPAYKNGRQLKALSFLFWFRIKFPKNFSAYSNSSFSLYLYIRWSNKHILFKVFFFLRLLFHFVFNISIFAFWDIDTIILLSYQNTLSYIRYDLFPLLFYCSFYEKRQINQKTFIIFCFYRIISCRDFSCEQMWRAENNGQWTFPVGFFFLVLVTWNV